jgi:hypothetical protein
LKDDLTYNKNFSDFLGSFWSSIFDNGNLGSALGGVYSETLIQNYLDLLEIINSISIDTVPVFSRQNVFPVIITKNNFYKNLDTPEYGDGSYYGIQPNESKYSSGDIIRYGTASSLSKKFFVELNKSNIVSLGSVALNRLFEPSVTYMNGVDFTLYRNGILFKEDPFLNTLIPKRKIIDSNMSEIDEEIILWFCDVNVDKFLLYKQFGYTFTNLNKSSEQYKEITKKLFELVSRGPSVFALRSYLSIISGSPLIKEVVETVIDIHKNESDETTLIVTDLNVYKLSINQKISDDIKIGKKLKSGTPLINVVDIVDTKNKNWWLNFSSLPLPKKSSTNVDTYVSFPNKYIKVKYGKKLSTQNILSTSIFFELIGSPDVVKNFWERVFEKAKQSQINYGYEIFKKYANYEDAQIDFSNNLEFSVNPAEIFSEDMFMGNILPIKIDLSKIKDTEIFFSTINPIKDNTPVNVILMFFLQLSNTDEYNMLLDELQNSATSVNLNDLLSVNTDEFPSKTNQGYYTPEFDKWGKFLDTPETIEAISIETNIYKNKSAGRFYKNNFNSSDISTNGFLLENFDLSSTTNLVQNIELKQIPKCAIL